jgi:ParB family chromosome partitioning protein
MTEKTPEIRMVPVDRITVLNPRTRNRRIFLELVDSIGKVGLKKPITVSPRPDGYYDLVCGQGRLEAFVALDQAEIPAVVIQATEQDCFVMSLVENLARRNHSPMELMSEIGALKARGYTHGQVAEKTGLSIEYVQAICTLLENGEERLLTAVERGIMPISIAIEIAKAKDDNVQLALAEVYEKKALPGNQVVAIRRIIEDRKAIGKALKGKATSAKSPNQPVTAEILIRSYRRETERQQLVAKKAVLAQHHLEFVVNAFRRLLSDEHFVTLLRAEAMHTLPGPLMERLGQMENSHG